MKTACCLSAGACLAAGLAASGRADGVAVTLNPAVRYQTIRGWSYNPHYIGGNKEQREQVIDEAVTSLGITRLRWQQPNGNRADLTRWELENDNGSPDVTGDTVTVKWYINDHVRIDSISRQP